MNKTLHLYVWQNEYQLFFAVAKTKEESINLIKEKFNIYVDEYDFNLTIYKYNKSYKVCEGISI